ncbi:hypothetical protein P8605_08710 [Streptomyces sp. T-3]|nr:hypothetical protein [Streptomyces sp. T-3]
MTIQTGSLAERAYAAAMFITRQTDTSMYGPYRGEEHARTAVRLAAALGLHWDDITITPDWRRRRTTPGEPLLATVDDHGQRHVFLSRFPVYQDDEFELLGPCPECQALVPVARVRHLGDLGAYLAKPPLAVPDIDRQGSVPDTFVDDAGHRGPCRWGDAR